MKTFIKPLFIATGVFVTTFVAAYVLSQLAKQQGWFDTSAASSVTAQVPQRPQLPGPAVQTVSNPASPNFWQSAVIIVAGQRHALEGSSISLPSGARFQVLLTNLPAGTVEIYAINPEGRADRKPLWAQSVDGNGRATSPDLRLQGTKGLETLKIVHRGASGASQRQVQIWHL